jgi:hypothetical protein
VIARSASSARPRAARGGDISGARTVPFRRLRWAPHVSLTSRKI